MELNEAIGGVAIAAQIDEVPSAFAQHELSSTPLPARRHFIDEQIKGFIFFFFPDPLHKFNLYRFIVNVLVEVEEKNFHCAVGAIHGRTKTDAQCSL